MQLFLPVEQAQRWVLLFQGVAQEVMWSSTAKCATGKSLLTPPLLPQHRAAKLCG